MTSAPSTPSTTFLHSPITSFFAIPSTKTTTAASLPAFLPSTPTKKHIPAWIRALGGLTIPSTPVPFKDVHDRRDYIQGKASFDKELGSRLENLAIHESSPKCDDDDHSSEDADILDANSLQRGTKLEGVSWLRAAQERVKNSGSVLVIGGGALGVQFATDIKHFYPEKKVTLVHSGPQLLPRFDRWLHEQSECLPI